MVCFSLSTCSVLVPYLEKAIHVFKDNLTFKSKVLGAYPRWAGLDLGPAPGAMTLSIKDTQRNTTFQLSIMLAGKARSLP